MATSAVASKSLNMALVSVAVSVNDGATISGVASTAAWPSGLNTVTTMLLLTSASRSGTSTSNSVSDTIVTRGAKRSPKNTAGTRSALSGSNGTTPCRLAKGE